MKSTRLFLPACLTAFAANPTVAQNDLDDPLEEIIVTGSRVLNLEDSSSPVVIVNAEDLIERPTTSVTEFLQRHLTSNYAAPDLSQETGASGVLRNAGNRETGVNLRGLGSQNTLILIDGRRTIEYPAFNRDSGWRTVDVNSTIPSIAVGSVQVLGDGGSAIYGSDAVAGVVNVIPNYSFRGAKLQARSTMFQDELGTPDATLGALFGVGDDDTNMIFAMELRQSDPLDQFQTGNAAYYPDPTVDQEVFKDRRDTGVLTYATLTGSRLTPRSRVTGLADPLCGDHAALGLDPIQAGLLLPNTRTSVGRGLPTTQPGSSKCEHFSRAAEPNQQLERQDISLFTALQHQFAPNVRVEGEVTYSRKSQTDYEGFLNASNVTIGNGEPIRYGFVIPNDHPGVQYNRTLDPAWNNAEGFVGIEMSPFSFGDKMSSRHEYDVLRGSFGVEVDLTDDWTLDANYVVATNEVRNSLRVAHVERFRRALLGLGGSGCSTAAPLSNAGVGGCQYYNPFMSAGLSNAAELGLANNSELMEYVTPEDESIFASDFTDFSVNVTGFAGELAGGSIGWSVGFARRTDELSVTRSPYTLSAELDGQTFPGNNIAGEADVNSVYAEVGLPLTDRLSMQVAVRQEEYNTGFSSVDPKIGFNWAATDQLTLRGSYGTSFRAPSIIHSGDIVIQERRFLWAADGRVVSPGNPMRANVQLLSLQQGNPDLQPQSSENITFGGDYRFDLDQSDLAVSFDFISVDFTNLIRVVSIAARLQEPECHIREFDVGNIADPRGVRPDVWENLPVNPETDPATGYPAQFGSCFDFTAPYDPTRRNVPTVVYGTSRNVARIETQAVDLGLQYGTDTGIGYVSVRPQLSYALKYETQETEGAAEVDALGFLGDARGVLAPTMPKIRASIPIGVDTGNHSARLIARYVSGVSDRVGTVAIEPAAFFDFNYTWRPNDSFRLGFFIDNVTGELYLEQGAGTFLPPYERRFGAQLYWDLLQ